MTLFVRKINRKNVDSIRKTEHTEDTPTDAVTSEFRTKENTLSIWQISDIENIEQGILAFLLLTPAKEP